jgi:hypothetical protein
MFLIREHQSLFYMKKRANKINSYLPIIFVLIIVVLAGLLVFFEKTSPVSVDNKQPVSRTPVVFDVNQYKTSVRELFTRLTVDNPSTAQEVKQKLLDMKVSKEFKDIHFELVMVSAFLENYFLSHDEQSLTKAKTLLAKLKKDYTWLSDKSL